MNGEKQNIWQNKPLDAQDVYNILELDKNNVCDVVKNENACMVIETSDWFYKVRCLDQKDPKIYFEQIVLKTLVSEYKEMGLEWNIFNVQDNENLYIVEEREKLTVASPSDFASFDDVLSQTTNIYRRVENRLEFPYLTSQIKQNKNYDMLQKVYLARDCKNDFADYALWNGHVIPLGNSKFFLALVDMNGKFNSSFPPNAIALTFTYGHFYFDDLTVLEGNILEKTLSRPSKWWLFPEKVVGNLKLDRENAGIQLKEMYTTNLNILTGKKPIQSKTSSDFTSILDKLQKK